MTTFFDFMSSIKDELYARYKSPFWGSATISLFTFHWKIVIFLIFDNPKASEAISFIEKNWDWRNVLFATVVAVLYAVVFPWIELCISMAASPGVRSRNSFQIRERERDLANRKIIAEQEAVTMERELKNKLDQSKLSDIERVNHYQQILSGDVFARWLGDVQKGVINSSLNNMIATYLNRYDSYEGKFIDSDIENAHEKFIESISLLQSLFNDGRAENESKTSDYVKVTKDAKDAQNNYRKVVREKLEI